MKKFLVRYEIQYQGLTIVGEEQGIEADSQGDAEDDVAERIRDNVLIVATAEEEDEDE